MKKLLLHALAIFALATTHSIAVGYKTGDVVKDFSLKNVDGSMVSLASIKDTKGYIVIFTCNHCPYSVAYEDRIIELHKNFAQQGFPVVAINPNSADVVPEDSYDNMVKRAKDKSFPFVYLHDDTQEIAKQFGATRTPHVFLVTKQGDKNVVSYIGAIDDNTDNPKEAKNKFVEKAIASAIAGAKPEIDFTKAIGCSIKWAKK